MSIIATYSGDPSESNRDYVRFLLGDTIEGDFLFGDAEIDGLLTLKGNVYAAAVVGAESLAARFSRLCDEEVGDVKAKLSQRARAYRELATKLRQQQAITSGIPYAGGISVSDKSSNVGDSDIVQPIFTRHMNDNPRASLDTDTEEDDGLQD